MYDIYRGFVHQYGADRFLYFPEQYDGAVSVTFEGYYEASNLGRIRSVERIVKSGRGHKTVPSVVLKPSIGEYGYESVSLSMNNKKYMRRVNRLVAQTFIDNPDNLPQVNHIDGNKTNNRVENLEWCNGSYNMQHCYANKLTDWETKIRIVETNEEFNSIVEWQNEYKMFCNVKARCS